MKKLMLSIGLVAALTAVAEVKPLKPGQSVPAVKLKTADGKPFDLQAAAKEQPLVIIFYRGGWCPYCNRHLGELQQLEPELRKLGFLIIAISPDRPEKISESLEKGKMTYTLLSDSSMAVAKAFGIAFELDAPTLEKLDSYDIDIEDASGKDHHLLPVPSVFLIGQDGLIDFAYSNPDYKVRLGSAELLKAAKAANKTNE